ncbi:MAG: NAD(P)/FAD-dependent oxidoreductase, partial [Spirochaetaceae bacterium]|nr:NAD(P)/FAD-dependent oxidoreductase [Spirochaetaceae bacterium]
RLAVLGGGIIGLEMAQVYSALGSEITIIEMLDQIIPPADPDLVRPLQTKLKKRYTGVYTSTKLTAVEAGKDALNITLEGDKAPKSIEADALLVSVGRSPNGKGIGAEEIGVEVDEKGFIPVNERMETKVPGIYAIGDVVGNPMLAHKAVHEGKVAAEVISGMKSAFTAMTIPSVAYTDPEIAWTGYTEKQAKAEGVKYEKGVFPWAASGRALSADKGIGTTKALFDPESGRLIGAGITGARAGDLIAEATLAIEMGADAADIGGTIHPHPTFAETIAFAAEMAEGTITDALPPKKKIKRLGAGLSPGLD